MDATDSAVRGYEQDHAGSAQIVLENGESTLVIEPAVGQRKRLRRAGAGGETSSHYRLENPADRPLQVYFGVEFCVALHPDALAAGEQPAYEFDGTPERGGFGASGIAKATTSIALIDP